MAAQGTRIRFAGREYRAAIEDGTGRVLVSYDRGRGFDLRSGAAASSRPRSFEVRQAAKAAISAVCELEELQAAHHEAVLAGRAPSQLDVVGVTGHVPESVPIEGGKYEFRSGRVLSDGTCFPTIRRGGDDWIGIDELLHPRFWSALAGALQDARAIAGLIEEGAADGSAAGQGAAAL